jgi:hypothetical protein
MKRLKLKHWQDIASVVLGVWLIASPWVLGIRGPLQAIGDFVAIGAVLGAFALTAVFIPESWEEWSDLVLGLWLIASPWILGFTDVPLAVENAMVCGGIITVLAVWVLGTDDEYGGWFHRMTG